MQRYRRLIISAGAILTVFIVRETGLDGGLLDALFQAIADAVTGPAEVAPVAEPQELPGGLAE